MDKGSFFKNLDENVFATLSQFFQKSQFVLIYPNFIWTKFGLKIRLKSRNFLNKWTWTDLLLFARFWCTNISWSSKRAGVSQTKLQTSQVASLVLSGSSFDKCMVDSKFLHQEFKEFCQIFLLLKCPYSPIIFKQN